MPAACETPKTCSVCGVTEGEPLGHSVPKWTVTVAATCTQDGTQTGVCDRCKETITSNILKLEHTPGDWKVTKKATATESGTRERYCTVCGQLANSETISSLESEIRYSIIGARKESINFSDAGDGRYNAEIVLVGEDYITKSLTRKGMLSKTSDILKELQNSLEERTDIANITILWLFPTVDNYGNSGDSVVMEIKVSKWTLDQINFTSFDWNNIPRIADAYYQHPDFPS